MDTELPENCGLLPDRLARIRPVMQRYVDEGKYAGIVSLIARKGKVAYFEQVGLMNIAQKKPMRLDTIFRIYSMTKPITSAAAMMLLEEGAFRLYDPVSAYIPAFKELKVIAHKAPDGLKLEDARREVNIHDLFTHTAGLSYGFDESDPLDKLYVERLWGKLQKNPDVTLAEMVDALTELPLAHQPGTAFRYSFSIDVLGRLIEVLSGKPLDMFLKERIFDPLGMVDTGFWVPPEKIDRFALNYGPDEKHPGRLKDIDPLKKSSYVKPVSFFSGGGGLVSTAMDYLRFCQMMLNGGELDGQRLLGRKTVDLMTSNHLPEGVYEDANQAYGFGLGGNVLVHEARAIEMASEGSWGWGGAANTRFWIDFKEQLIGILMLQFMPMGKYPVIQDFQNLTYQALA